MKKILATITILAFAATTVTGCSGNGDELKIKKDVKRELTKNEKQVEGGKVNTQNLGQQGNVLSERLKQAGYNVSKSPLFAKPYKTPEPPAGGAAGVEFTFKTPNMIRTTISMTDFKNNSEMGNKLVDALSSTVGPVMLYQNLSYSKAAGIYSVGGKCDPLILLLNTMADQNQTTQKYAKNFLNHVGCAFAEKIETTPLSGEEEAKLGQLIPVAFGGKIHTEKEDVEVTGQPKIVVKNMVLSKDDKNPPYLNITWVQEETWPTKTGSVKVERTVGHKIALGVVEGKPGLQWVVGDFIKEAYNTPLKIVK